jgi:hypothetical protein
MCNMLPQSCTLLRLIMFCPLPHSVSLSLSPRRAKIVLELLKKEVELCKLQQDIREQVRRTAALHAAWVAHAWLGLLTASCRSWCGVVLG